MSESPNRTTGSDPGDLPAHPEVIRIATQLGLGPDDLETLMDVARDADAIVRLHKEREERRREATPQHPTRLIFRNQDPWPEPVATAELLRTLTAAISAHVALPQGGSQIVALWAMHTHALGAFSVTPRLVIRSRQPRSGKTTLLSLLAQLTPRPLKVCALSPRAVSWSLRYRPTLLLDDGNTLIDAIGEVRAILRNGHSRLAGHLLNARPGFSSDLDLFAAAAIAVEGDAPQILSGRSIEIELERPLSGEGITRLDQGAMDRLSQLHQMAARWAQDRMESLSAAQAAAPYRADDYWTPLLLITADAGPQWQRQAHTAMQIIRDASASNLERLLADIRALIGERRSGRRQITDA